MNLLECVSGSANNLILLSGPSLQNLATEITTLTTNDALFYAINQKNHIEEKILSKIGRKVDVWCILSPDEIQAQLDEVYKFLADTSTKAFITSSIALKRISDKIANNPLPNQIKIILADDWIYQTYQFYYAQSGVNIKFNTIEDANGDLNTLFIMLFGLISSKVTGNFYLFGCDGTKAKESHQNTSIYFDQNSYTLKRLQASNLYNDMVRFDRYWLRCLTYYGYRNDHKRIINTNTFSHYTAFKKANLNSAANESNYHKDFFVRLMDKIRMIKKRAFKSINLRKHFYSVKTEK